MDPRFWHQRWKQNEIGFHNDEANPILEEYFNELSLKNGSRVFVPLCGKTLDISWLVSRGFHVVGVELSKIAVEQLFEELDIEPERSKTGPFEQYSSEGVDIFVGDFFDLSRGLVYPVDAVYDRAALVAFPREMRKRYTSHLIEVSDNAKQLLVCYNYDQKMVQGPPFSISKYEVNYYYSNNYRPILRASKKLPEKLKGKYAAKEEVWILEK